MVRQCDGPCRRITIVTTRSKPEVGLRPELEFRPEVRLRPEVSRALRPDVLRVLRQISIYDPISYATTNRYF